MRILFDITHPAQVHFFKHLIWKLRDRGDEVLVATRQKDVTIDLLDRLGIPYECLSRKGQGMRGMAKELVERYAKLLRVAVRFRPDVMMAQTGVSIGLVGAALGVPRLVLEEAEHARLQQMLGLPFATAIFTGTGYTKDYGPRQVKFRGIWVQSYLHPNYFTPRVEPLLAAGVDPTQRLIVLRTVSWAAAHDVGLRGTSEAELLQIVQRLSRHGRVLISSEGELPASLRKYINPVPVENVHDLLAAATLYIGEGGTMAAEAAVLGTPAVFCNHLRVGYLLALEKQYGLAFNTDSLIEGLPLAEGLLARNDLRQEWGQRHRKLMAQSEDVTGFMLDLVDRAVRCDGAGSAVSSRREVALPRPRKVVIPIVAGIGNALMTVPMVRQLKRGWPAAQVTVVARLSPMGEVFRRLSEVDRVMVVGNDANDWADAMFAVRGTHPDVCLIPFPSNRWQYATVALASGAPRRILHSYPVGYLRTLAFLPGERPPARRGIHDVVQNLLLLRELGIEPDLSEAPVFAVYDGDRARAGELLAAAGFNSGAAPIAVHAGSAQTILARAKRWPPASYASLIRRLRDDLRLPVVLLEGPDEIGVSREILSQLSGERPPIVRLRGGLGDAAAVLERARLYVGSDSGLAHLAAAVGTPPVTLFAPADPDRVCPFGYRHLVVGPRSCPLAPCFMYPWQSPYPKIKCSHPHCIQSIDVDSVLATVTRALHP